MRDVGKVSVDKFLDALSTKVEEFATVFLFLLLRNAILGLGDLEPAISTEGNKADSEVGTTEVNCDIVSLLLSSGAAKYPGWEHGL